MTISPLTVLEFFASLAAASVLFNAAGDFLYRRKLRRLSDAIRHRARSGQPPYIDRHGHLLRQVRRPVHRKK